jgi:hypothetical protein
MKKMYNSIKTFVVLLSLVAFKVGAAPITGTVTINQTIPSSATNYTSISAFAIAVNSLGISGAVVADVAAGTGPYVEQPIFTSIAGTSANSRLTLNGNGNLLTFNATNSSLPHTLLLNGTKFMTVNNLQIQGTNGNYAMVCILTNQANYNLFSACSFSCPANGTSSYHIPFSFNSSTSLPSAGGNPGNFNTIRTSTLSSGYYSIWHYGLSAAPYTSDNSFIDCYITDFYYYCIYGIYAKNLTFRGCTFDRASRTTMSTYTYFFYGQYNSGIIFENNTVKTMYSSLASSGYYFYGFYYTGYYNPQPGNRNVFRNNIIRDFNTDGYVYLWMYNYYADNDYYHNTISFDRTTSTSGASIYLWYYCYAGSNGTNNYVNNWKNNIITITQGGGGGKYAYYIASNTGINIDKNDVYVNGAGGNNYYGYTNALATTFAQWQSQGQDVNGYNLNPNYTNLAAGDVRPTNAALNNLGTPLGVLYDHQGAIRNPLTPDLGALEFLTPLCTGTPTTTIVGPTYSVCPGETVDFSLNGLSADLGITYQWQVSTISNVGPFTGISGASNITYTSGPITQQSWYSAVITCTNPGGSSTSPVVQVNLSPMIQDNIPYYEGFENIGKPNRLPNCSWASPNLGSTAFTYNSATTQNRLPRNGTSFGSFSNGTPGVNYFYTNGIWMEPGITYSATVWYQTDFTGAANWTDLSILLVPAQAPANATTIATTGGAAISPVYKALTNTYTVGSAAYYYVAFRGTANAGTAAYLSMDDISIIIPCTPSVNVVPLAVSANNSTVCSNTAVNLTASGANTYVWNTGNTGPNNSQYPSVNPTIYSVIGTNTITGCSTTVNKTIFVKQSPVISVAAFPPVACSGQPVTLSASGANTYLWSNSNTGAITTVTPSGNTSFTVIGTNSLNCSSSAVAAVQVRSNPTITVNGPQQICLGETATLIGSGATSFKFMASTAFVQSNPAVLQPNTPTTYTVVGTDAYGCTGTTQYNLNVDPCLGLNKNTLSTNVMVYPNPTSADLKVLLASGTIISLEVVDLTGRVVLNGTSKGSEGSISMETLANGVYYVKVAAGNTVEVIKVVKN